MSTISGGMEFKIPAKMTSILGRLRDSVPDRGMAMSKIVIGIAVKDQEEKITQESEAKARQLLGSKVDQLV